MGISERGLQAYPWDLVPILGSRAASPSPLNIPVMKIPQVFCKMISPGEAMLAFTSTAFFGTVFLLACILVVHAELVSVPVGFTRESRTAAVKVAFELLTG